jgi:hypothetical protein
VAPVGLPLFFCGSIVLDILIALVNPYAMAFQKYIVPMMACFIFWLIFGPAAVAGDTQDVPRISVHQTKKLMDSPDTIVIDVRKYRNWWRSSKKIPTAIREDPSKVDQWIEKFGKNQTLIFYCS